MEGPVLRLSSALVYCLHGHQDHFLHPFISRVGLGQILGLGLGLGVRLDVKLG